MQASMEEAGYSLGENETRTGLPASRRGGMINSKEGGAFSIMHIETGRPTYTKTGRGGDEEHTCKDLHRQNFGTGLCLNLRLEKTRVSGLLLTIAGSRTPRKLKCWSSGEIGRATKVVLGIT